MDQLRPLGRGDWPLAVAALLAGLLFFSVVARLWPLIPGELRPDTAPLRAKAAALDGPLGTHLERYRLSSRLRVDDPALTWVESAFGRERATALLREGLPLAWHRLTFKEPGNADSVTVGFLPDGRLMGWERTVQEDTPGRELVGAEAEARAREVDGLLGVDLSRYRVVERSWRRHPNRVDHRFAFERDWNEHEDDDSAVALRERIDVVVSGERISKAWRSVVVPGAADRAQRARRAPIESVAAIGFALLAAGGVVALAISLRRLIAGQARLGPPAKLVAIVAVLLVLNNLLQQPMAFERWDPLWPRWVAQLKDLAYDLMDDLVVLLTLFFFVCAGDALDRAPRADGVAPGRAASLWALGRGRFGDPAVVAASTRGFLVGALCGGVLALGALAALWLPGGRIALQPRGFFFYPLNSAAPALTTLCFFAHIALIEELGYRFFAGTWLDRLTRHRWIAIVAPAAVYGLCHTSFDFLPPVEPFWVRPILLGLVGCVWGWAFFRFDALTVVLSHLTCDLFIFNWPSLAGGGSGAVLAALAISVPLWPAAAGLAMSRSRKQPAASG